MDCDNKVKGNVEVENVILQRNIGLTTGCSLIIGGIIGSGIFVSPQGVLLGAGSYGLSLVIWAVCGLLSLCGALTYAEMGTIIPKSGSAYYYIMEVYGDCAAFVYMFTWVFFALPSGIAIVALTCSEYLMAIFFQDDCGTPPEVIRQSLATVLILFVSVVNVKSVDISGTISVIFTIAKVAALAVIIMGGIVKLGQGYTENLDPANSFKGTSTSVSLLAEAFLSGMWAYSGWEGLNFMTEELKNPNKTLPQAIFISLPLVTAIYLLTNIAYFTVMSPQEITASAAVAMTWANYVIPNLYWFVPLSVAMSTFGAACGTLMLNSRLLFVAAREDHLLDILAMIHVKYLTPAPAVFLLTALSVMYVYLGTIVELIGYTGVAVWFFHGMVGVGVIIFRFTRKNIIRPYKCPIICPIILILFSTLLSLGPIIGNPQWGYFFAISVMVVGAILWVLLVKLDLHIPGLDTVTMILQLFSQAVPPGDKIELENENIHHNDIPNSLNTKYGSVEHTPHQNHVNTGECESSVGNMDAIATVTKL